MGLGFAVPYIGMFRGEAARLGALMPASQGALGVAGGGQRATRVMVEEAMLPLADASVDLLLARALPGGVRARRAAAARDVAGAGAGGPPAADRAQPARHLGAARHHALRPRPALQPRRSSSGCSPMPCSRRSNGRARCTCRRIDRQWLVRWATGFERVGARLWPGFAGVIIVEARKELMGAIPKGKPARGVRRPRDRARHPQALRAARMTAPAAQ